MFIFGCRWSWDFWRCHLWEVDISLLIITSLLYPEYLRNLAHRRACPESTLGAGVHTSLLKSSHVGQLLNAWHHITHQQLFLKAPLHICCWQGMSVRSGTSSVLNAQLKILFPIVLFFLLTFMLRETFIYTRETGFTSSSPILSRDLSFLWQSALTKCQKTRLSLWGSCDSGMWLVFYLNRRAIVSVRSLYLIPGFGLIHMSLCMVELRGVKHLM